LEESRNAKRFGGEIVIKQPFERLRRRQYDNIEKGPRAE
jgi:hypothetical protein